MNNASSDGYRKWNDKVQEKKFERLKRVKDLLVTGITYDAIAKQMSLEDGKAVSRSVVCALIFRNEEYFKDAMANRPHSPGRRPKVKDKPAKALAVVRKDTPQRNERRDAEILSDEEAEIQATAKLFADKPDPIPVVEVDGYVDPHVPPVPRNLTLLQLEWTECRWPTGREPHTHLFCGHRVNKYPYCPYHTKNDAIRGLTYYEKTLSTAPKRSYR